MPLYIADVLIRAAEARSRSIGVPMVIALSDQSGVLQRYSRMDGAIQGSVEIAQNKAYTAALLQVPTHVLGPLVQPGGEFYGLQNTHNGRFVFFGGGMPLNLDGQLVAALGVSGGSAAQDLEVAGAAAQAWEAICGLAKVLKQNSGIQQPGQPQLIDDEDTGDRLALAKLIIKGAVCLVPQI